MWFGFGVMVRLNSRCLITRKEKWLGKPICKRKDGVYYAKVGIKGEVFRIGDTVEIRIVSENKVNH